MNPVLLPVVAAQGAWVRRRTEVLPEASGATAGEVGGTGDPLRVVVIGESTAAGCGADTHDEAFGGQFARGLVGRFDRAVAWAVHGKHGATLRRVRFRLLPEVRPGCDVAVLLIGVNDVLGNTALDRWREDLEAVVDGLSSRADQLIVAGIPSFDEFRKLPRLLRRYLAERAGALDAVAAEICASRGATWVSSDDLGAIDAAFFARDDFHPSPAGYRQWAYLLANYVTDRHSRPQNCDPPI